MEIEDSISITALSIHSKVGLADYCESSLLTDGVVV